MPANPQATGVFSASPVCGTFSFAYGTSFSCIRHISCMIHVIKCGFLIGTCSDLLGGLSQVLYSSSHIPVMSMLTNLANIISLPYLEHANQIRRTVIPKVHCYCPFPPRGPICRYTTSGDGSRFFVYLTKRVFSRLGETKILLESPSSNLRELEIPN